MSTAELSLSPRPELVRIARMMSVALARRGGVPEDLLPEVRLAVGEAASRAVLVHERVGSDAPVRLTFVEDDRGYEVRIHDDGSIHDVPDAPDEGLPAMSADDAVGGLPPELALALIAGMADDLSVLPDPIGGTLVVLRWRR
ncbi:MAG TPA: ATP-binding protein [Mycobacteriales bacterium]